MNERLRVLVIENDSSALSRLELGLQHLRSQWDLTFLPHGDEAVFALEAGQIDVVVCPQVPATHGGTDVLSYAREHRPEVLRIALAIEGDAPDRLAAINVAHTCLPRHPKAGAIEAAVRQTARIQTLLQAEAMRDLVLGLTVLPSLPSVLNTLLDELRSPYASVARVGELISQDPGLTAQLLRVVNSPVVGLARPVGDPALAVTLLGLDTVAAMLVQHHLFALANERVLDRLGLGGLYAHCTRTGRLAATAGRHFGCSVDDVSLARAAGVLHDAGKLLLALNFPDRYQHAHELAAKSRMPMRVAETMVIGAPHDWVGGLLLALWGMPNAIVEAVAFHHDPRHDGIAAGGALGLVHLANVLEHSREPGALKEVDTNYLNAVGYVVDGSTWQQLAEQE